MRGPGRTSAALAVAALTAAVATTPAAAKTFEVTTRADHKPGKCSHRDCTLREAVIRANEHDGQDRVVVPGSERSYALTRAGADEDAAKRGDLDVSDLPLDIRGKGRKPVVVKQTVADRVFHVLEPDGLGDALFDRLTIRGGDSESRGGGLYTEGEAFLSDSAVRDNHASQGGGVAAFGADARIGITNSTVSGNRADLAGGGAYVVAAGGGAGTLQSTISGNRAPQGGGIYFNPGAEGFNVTTSTITGNRASQFDPDISTGGGIFIESSLAGPGRMKIGQSTIAQNEAPPGRAANIHAELQTQLENTLIADPVGAPSCDVALDSVGHNLDEATSCGLDQGTDVESAEAALKPLADNGGATPTMALKASSDAIGEGSCPGTIIQRGVDQRGAGRPNGSQGVFCDIGAFERDPTSPPD